MMRVQLGLSILALACVVPASAHAQQSKVTCADNTIVTTTDACADHGGVQKPGGLHRVGRQLNKAAIDVKHEAKRTPKNVAKAAKTTGNNIGEAAEDVGSGTKKLAKKAAHGTSDAAEDLGEGTSHALKKTRHSAGQAAGEVSSTAQKVVHPRVYYASCNDGTTWRGRSKKNACLNHGGIATWTDSTGRQQ